MLHLQPNWDRVWIRGSHTSSLAGYQKRCEEENSPDEGKGGGREVVRAVRRAYKELFKWLIKGWTSTGCTDIDKGSKLQVTGLINSEEDKDTKLSCFSLHEHSWAYRQCLCSLGRLSAALQEKCLNHKIIRCLVHAKQRLLWHLHLAI